MKYTTLVRIKNFLVDHDDSALTQGLDRMIEQCEHYMRNVDYNRYCDTFVHLKDDYSKVVDVVEAARARRNHSVREIDVKLAEFDREFIERDQKAAANANTVEGNRTFRSLYIDDQTKTILRARISKLVDWRFPGLEIGPGDGVWTRKLVACDPLYLADIHQEFLDSTLSQFNSQYQKRLRAYLIRDNDLSSLPQNQFGFVFAWNVFNYLPLNEIEQYLKSIYDLLRPGGTLLFSYNNSGRVLGAAERAEVGVACHTPKNLLLPTIQELGYATTGDFDAPPYVSWLELTKPGELKTSKAHPVLGQIIEKKS
jgi:phospholipid N-methyltransferase